MILLSVAFAILVSILAALAAIGAESVARVLRFSTRWIWVAGLALSIGLSVAAVLVRPTASPPAEPVFIGGIEAASARSPAGWLGRMRAGATAATRWFDASTYTRRLQRTDLARVPSAAIFAAWGATSVVVGILFVAVHARLRSARRRWPRAEVMGVRVRVAPHIGPSAMGFARPEIIIPQWLTMRSGWEQRMAIEHETQHICAHDPELLTIAWLAAIALPWNPAVWFMLSRLRLAMEVDCDARVLRSGAGAAEYGSLLLMVAEHASPIRPSALALADDASHLRSRIVAMDHHVSQSARARAAAMGMLGAVALLVACEAKAPTAAELDRLDGATAAQAARRLGYLTDPDSNVVYRIDGAVVSPQAVRALEAEKIAAIETRRIPGSEPEIRITTSATALRAAPDVPRKLGPAPKALSEPDTAIVWFVNGVRTTFDAGVKVLNRADIESVEIIKGDAAEAIYNVPRGHGVVAIKTKK